MKFFCCDEHCGKHYPDSIPGNEHWKHVQLGFREYLRHKKAGHDVYWRF